MSYATKTSGAGSTANVPYRFTHIHNNQNFRDIYELLEGLCKSFVPPDNEHRDILRQVTQYVSNCPAALSSSLPFDEVSLVAKITRHVAEKSPTAYTSSLVATATTNNNNNPIGITSTSSPSNSILFGNLYEELKASHLNSHQRSAILTFLYKMADSKYKPSARHQTSSIPSRGGSTLLSSHAAPSSSGTRGSLLTCPSSRAQVNAGLSSSNSTTTGSGAMTSLSLATTTSSTSCSSSSSSTTNFRSHMPSSNNTAIMSTSELQQRINLLRQTGSSLVKNNGEMNLLPLGVGNQLAKRQTNYHHEMVMEQQQHQQRTSTAQNPHDDLVQNVIYSFTGITGKYLKKDLISGRFKLENKAKTLNVTEAGMLLRLAELGYYHDLVQSYTNTVGGRCALGLMGQGFVSALRNELTKYYGMVAMLQEQLNKQRQSEMQNCYTDRFRSEKLSMMKILVWSVDALQRLQLLSTIAEATQDKKGGSLASAVYAFLNNGNPTVQSVAKELLLATCGPFYQMLTKWLLEGELCDPKGEFFIESSSQVSPDHLWYDKYRIRPSMLPSFISTELAHKILVTGKSINFLYQICEDKQPAKVGDELRQCIEENAEQIFARVADTKLHSTIDSIYLNTSKRVLDIVMGPYKLLEHLQAMRRYLLLGQGDFIAILMESLKTELDKPGKELYSYDLSSIMDGVIRSTCPQHDELEIPNHLDVRLMTPCEGDTGWDIISLQYTVKGPLATILKPSMNIYQGLFKPLWRMKHMEFVLSTKIWKDQQCNSKPLRSMSSEIQRVTYRLNLLTSEMIHFIHQMQYYVLFEVIECSWAELLTKVQQAKALDDILQAHDEFLNSIRNGVFLAGECPSKTSNVCSHKMQIVYDNIIHLEVWQNKFYALCFKELEARRNFQEEIISSEKAGRFGVTTERQLERDQENKIFEQTLSSHYKSLEIIANDFSGAVRCFLLALNSNNDHNLQLFGIRLDFNEFYKKRDQRLGVPLTFEHMRMSNVFNSSSSRSLIIGSTSSPSRTSLSSNK